MKENVVKYLYVDDSDNANNFISALNSCDDLEIQIMQPTEKRLDLINQIVSNYYDGLIVDQQLYEKIIKNNGSEYEADYTGSSLSFDVRSEQKQKLIKDNVDYSLPIVLYSADPNVPDIIESTGRELFDYVIYKGSSSYNKFKSMIPLYQQILISLGRGYKTLKEKREPSIIFALDDLSDIDSRFIESFHICQEDMVSVQARFVINELIIKQGILIDEDVLAVRLGINKMESNDWSIVLDSLKKFNADYRGVFCDGWSRWWMPMVEKWWYSIINSGTYIRFYDAEQRASSISAKLGIRLVPAKAKSKYTSHNEYWTLCDKSKEPLDIEDGLLLPKQDNLYPWQDAKYVSIETALNGSIEVAERDKGRLNDLKKQYR